MAVAGGGTRALLRTLALCALAAGARAQPAAPLARVYGLEIERARAFDRLLVFVDRPVTPRLEEPGPEQLVLHFPGAELDPTAPQHLVPGAGSAIRELRAVAVAEPAPEVQVRIRRAAGAAPRLSRQGAIVALEFPRSEEQEERRVAFRLVDRPLVELVREVQQQTGTRFIYDDRLQGTATVIVTDPITSGEALEILHSTLIGKGFAAVPTPSGVFAVVPIEDGRARSPKQTAALRAERAGLVTVLQRLAHAQAETVVDVLQPAAGSSITAVAYAPTNAVILVGSEGPVLRWLDLAQALDEAGQAELVVIRPRHRGAAELFPLLEQAARDPLTGRPRAELWLDERTNALIARAAPPALAALRAQLAELDTAPAAKAPGEVAVIRLEFADPEKLAGLLRAGASGTGSATGGGEADALFGRSFGVAVHAPLRALLVSGDATTQRLVRDVVEKLDREPAAIELEMQIVELITDGAVELSVNAFIPTADPADPGNVVAISINDPFTDPLTPPRDIGFGRYVRNPVIVTRIDPVTGLPALDPITGLPLPPIVLPREIVDVRASAGDVVARSVMRPHLMTASGEEQEITAGLNVPVLSSATAAEGAVQDPLETRVNVERQDVGLRLRVKPVAGDAGDVKLTVDVEVSNLRDDAAAVAAAAGARSDLGPLIQKRTLHANAVFSPGGAVVLGMLLDKSLRSFESGPPFVKDAPVVGTLLRRTLETATKSHLVIAIQANKLRSAEERIADAIRLRTGHERALARRSALRMRDDSWALLLGTRAQRADAEALAAEIGEVAGRAPRVSEWTWDGATRFDVTLAGFRDLAEAVEALNALQEAGTGAQLLAVPGRAGESEAGDDR